LFLDNSPRLLSVSASRRTFAAKAPSVPGAQKKKLSAELPLGKKFGAPSAKRNNPAGKLHMADEKNRHSEKSSEK
jgi:hypothetical protein